MVLTYGFSDGTNGAAPGGGGWERGSGDKMTCWRVPFWSMICWTMWPGGTCIGRGRGGVELVETILIVAGPEKERKGN